jgi:crotonobetainyl-CoA:carnitine CoA-transferase CaiB-like acyl-CoA transferase
LVVEVEHPRAGRVKALGMPIKFSDTPGETRRAAPLLGEHTREVLEGIGYSAADIERLAAEGAIACA